VAVLCRDESFVSVVESLSPFPLSRARRGRFERGARGVVGSYEEVAGTLLAGRLKRIDAIFLHQPFSYLTDEGSMGGFLDGLLARTLVKESHLFAADTVSPDRSLMGEWIPTATIEGEGEAVRLKMDEDWVFASLLTILYHSYLNLASVMELSERSLWWHALRADRKRLKGFLSRALGLGLVERVGGRYTCTEKGCRAVESFTPPSQAARGEFRGAAFTPWLPRKPIHLEDEGEVRAIIEDLLYEDGWFTLRDVRGRMEGLEGFDFSKKALYRGMRELSSRMGLRRSIYYKGVGRPEIAYYKKDEDLPPHFHDRCGRCAFYVRQRMRCRLWHPLHRRFGWRSEELEEGLSKVEEDRLRLSWRLNPRATACREYVRRKRDYVKTRAEGRCDICRSPLKLEAGVVRCEKCETTYHTLRSGRIRVHPAYESLFRRRYLSIAGETPEESVEAIEEAKRGDMIYMLKTALAGEARAKEAPPPSKRPVVLYPGDEVEVRGNHLTRGKERIPIEGVSRVIDYGCLPPPAREELERRGIEVSAFLGERARTASTTGGYMDLEFRKGMEDPALASALARRIAESVALSLISSTERIGGMAGVPEHVLEKALREQRRIFEVMRGCPVGALRSYEGLVGMRYWQVFREACTKAGFLFGGRKRDRLVREFVRTARGRARGYNPINAMINYLHQRRLTACRIVNAEEGLGWASGEGLLHRLHENDSIGLALDLSDPFKVADRELLLEACLERRVSWRDCEWQLGRQGARFYYPGREAIAILEEIGNQADSLPVQYGGERIPLMEAYRKHAKSFVEAVKKGDVALFSPFILGDSHTKWLNPSGEGSGRCNWARKS
jgi:CRISPR/Cas system-associated endonuclease Cas1